MRWVNTPRKLRATYNLKSPDALQIAVALRSGCGAFLSNDRALRRVPDKIILILDDLEVKTDDIYA